MNDKRWLVRPGMPDETRAQFVQAGFPPLIAQLLYNRDLPDPGSAQRFLEPRREDTGDPFQLNGLPAAVDRLLHALRAGERIAIYGDYDTDGVTATALLVQVLRALGADVQHYIPDREEEGYGLNHGALHTLKNERGAAVVVTVDCGVRALAEAETARTLGLDLIITDHHEPYADLPAACAVINPKQPGDAYPERNLAGVGLAFKLAQGLVRSWPGQAPISASDVLDLVALGTVADLAPLQGENRWLVREGLRMINERMRRPGLEALIRVADLKPGKIDAANIGFALGPRLNAAGRLESAQAAYELLMAPDSPAAWELAQTLDRQNRERQEKTRQTQDRARELALAEQPQAALLFAADPDFRAGVVGLAASRLTDEFYRPAVVAAIGPEETRGSGRSIHEFDITAALDECADLLVKYGGHKAAAGFTIRNDDLPQLAARLRAIAERELGAMELRPTLKIDADNVALPELTEEVYRWLRQFEPCGFDNPTPVLATRGLKVENSRLVGKDARHLKLTVSAGAGPRFDAIAFGHGDWYSRLPRFVDLAYCLELNEWNGSARLQLNVRSLRPSE